MHYNRLEKNLKIKKKNIVCLICCRGESKTIKNKNIKNFSGKPLLYWTINNAKKSKIFDQIIVSTDSRKIEQLAKNNGATSPGLRPKYLSTDKSDQFDTHNYIFQKLKFNDENIVICILNNNPFINFSYLKKSFIIFKKYKFKKIVTDCARVSGDYLFFKQFEYENNKLSYINKKTFLNSKINRQSLKKLYVNIFNIRWGKPYVLSNYEIFKKNLLIKNNHVPIFLNKLHNFDIDDLDDWKIAETLFTNLIMKN